jgi:hypothetical protein
MGKREQDWSAQDRGRWRALLNAIMNLLITKNEVKYITSWKKILASQEWLCSIDLDIRIWSCMCTKLNVLPYRKKGRIAVVEKRVLRRTLGHVTQATERWRTQLLNDKPPYLCSFRILLQLLIQGRLNWQ